MTAGLRYAAAGTVLVGLTVAALWPLLDPRGRSGVLLAAAVALAIQVPAFVLLVRGRRRGGNAFLAAWAGGTVVRMAAVLAAGLILIRATAFAPAPTLLGLAGFFFGLLLLEPFCWGPARERTTDSNRS